MNKLTNCLINKDTSCFPVWFMRQAGRYLPEFRKIRANNPDFIKLCLNSNLSSEITLQPIKRFNFDSAIIFSDILMVPFSLGQSVKFIKGKGPILSDFNLEKFLANDSVSFKKKLNPVYKAIQITRNKLSKEKSLISFIGAPWTLLIYMLGAKKDKNEIEYKKITSQGSIINTILNKLNDYLCDHIENQIKSGADIVQIFDSWAGLIPNQDLAKYCYVPNSKIIEFCRSKNIPVICFPRGLGKNYKDFNNIVKPDGINLDYEIDPLWAKQNLENVIIQGGLDPKILLLSEEKIKNSATKYFKAFNDIPYIFNLGHGLLPETDPDKVEMLVKFYREYKQ